MNTQEFKETQAYPEQSRCEHTSQAYAKNDGKYLDQSKCTYCSIVSRVAKIDLVTIFDGDFWWYWTIDYVIYN